MFLMSYRLERKRGPAAVGVAHIGCPREGGRLLRVRVADHQRRRFRVRCGCGAVHEGTGPGRPLRDGEAPPTLAEIDPTASAAEGAPTAPAKPPRRKVSDAAILAALSAVEDRPAAVVAEALGYANTAPLTSRIRRMNSAAGSPLVEIKREGRRVVLRLAVSSYSVTADTAKHPHNPDREGQESP